MNKNIITKEMMLDGKKLELETGVLANQANMAVKATYGDSVILATATSAGANPRLDYFPLSIIYEEKLYASGSIKNSKYMKRDGRPSDDAVVTRRLIDHAVRPLFPNGYQDDVQVVLTVLSLDKESDIEALAMIAASAALHASDIPWEGPMVSAKVGFINDDYVLNPSYEQQHHESDVEMMVSFVGQDMKFLAIECMANQMPEEKVLGAIEYARSNLEGVLELITDFAEEVNPGGEKYEYESHKPDETLVAEVSEIAKDRLAEIYKLKEARERSDQRDALVAEVQEKYEENEEIDENKVDKAFSVIEKKVVQGMILNDSVRPDGRKLNELREISADVGILPRTHGTGLFSRGETQALTVATLGNPSNEIHINDMYGEKTKNYMHYYNFPPYSTGETGRMGSPGGREIGHGMLAEKGLVPVIPGKDEFPYTILLMTEILSSNGSSSMASTCGSTLALLDAGVPIENMVAGISIGLVADEENDNYVLLTDIMGLEDFCGHMDFKIAGSDEGVTAIQLDMKVKGIPMELLPKVFEQAKEARLEILKVMSETIDSPRSELSEFAPKMLTIKVQPDQVGMIIGSGGKTIKEIQEKTGADIGIEDDGTVFISSPDQNGAQQAYDIIDGMTKEVKPGEIYDGVIEEVVDFGAFVEILPGRTGLLHVSEVSDEYVENVSDHLKDGQEVKVRVLSVDPSGKMSLSIKAVDKEFNPEDHKPRNSGRGGRGGRNDRGNRRNNRR